MSFAVVVALALTAAPDAGVRPAPFAWDVPGQLELVPVGNRLDVNGRPVSLYLAHSSWELNRLLLHYAARFSKAGFFIPPRMGRIVGLKLPRVVALDDSRWVSFLVYGWPEPDGTTTLVLGAADLGHRKVAQAGGLPVFPGAKRLVTADLEGARTLSFEAHATPAEVIDFYRAVLPSGGFQEREPGVFVKDGRAVEVLARPRADASALDVVVLEQADLAPLTPEQGR